MNVIIRDISDLTAALDVDIFEIDSAHGDTEGFIRGKTGDGGEKALYDAIEALPGVVITGMSWDGGFLRIFVRIDGE